MLDMQYEHVCETFIQVYDLILLLVRAKVPRMAISSTIGSLLRLQLSHLDFVLKLRLKFFV